MKCSLCPNTALRAVGKVGFCKVHRSEADAAAVKDQRHSQSRRGMMDILRWDTGRFIRNEEADTVPDNADVP